jgi:NAD kinase
MTNSSKGPYARSKTAKEEAMAAVTKNWRVLLHGDEYDAFKGDKDVMMAAIKQDGWALKLADEALRGDKEVVMAAVTQEDDGEMLEFASDRLKDDKEVVKAAVKYNGFALEFASDRLKNEKDIVMAAKEQNRGALEFASERWQNRLKKEAPPYNWTKPWLNSE